MKFGLQEKHLLQLETLLFRPLKDAGFKIWIFGSRARGDHRPFSDIDLLYQLPETTTNFASLISRLKENLEEGPLPYKIDLVDINDLAESYKEKILRERVEI
jgi:predicted nucleotidyltransferase